MTFAHRTLLFFASALATLFLAPAVFAEPAPAGLIHPGTVLIYESPSLRQQEQLVLTITEMWPGGITWEYTYYDHGILDAEGVDTIPARDVCRSIAPWMIPEGGIDDSCDFWLSPDQFLALNALGKTYFATERNNGRGDTRLEKTGTACYDLRIDGRTTCLTAVTATSTRSEQYIILDDRDLPLILSSTHAGLRLTEIRTAVIETK